MQRIYLCAHVSIQPKPKKGLVGLMLLIFQRATTSFNPAEAEEGFSRNYTIILHHNKDGVSIQPKPKKGLVGKETIPTGKRIDKFQSSRSRRRV